MKNVSLRVFVEDYFGNKLSPEKAILEVKKMKVDIDDFYFHQGGIEICSNGELVYQTRATTDNFEAVLFLLQNLHSCGKFNDSYHEVRPINHLNLDWSTTQFIEQDSSFLSFYNSGDMISIRYSESELILCTVLEWSQIISSAINQYFDLVKKIYLNQNIYNCTDFYKYESIFKSMRAHW